MPNEAILVMLTLLFAGATLVMTIGFLVIGMRARRLAAAGSFVEADFLTQRARILRKTAVVLMALVLVSMLLW